MAANSNTRVVTFVHEDHEERCSKFTILIEPFIFLNMLPQGMIRLGVEPIIKVSDSVYNIIPELRDIINRGQYLPSDESIVRMIQFLTSQKFAFEEFKKLFPKFNLTFGITLKPFQKEVIRA